MQTDSVAERYAKALLGIASDQNKIEPFGKDIDVVAAPYASSAELRLVLSHPGIAIVQRKAVLNGLLAKLPINPMVANFFRLLIDRSRFGLLPQIVVAYRRLADERAGRVRGLVHSAVALSSLHLASLTKAMAGVVNREVILEEVVDESLIGGLRVEIEGRVYDGTVKGQLARIREKLMP